MKFNQYLKSFILLILLGMPSFQSFAIEIEASLSKEEIRLDEPVTLKVTIQKERGYLSVEELTFDAPNFNISTRSKSTHLSSVYEGGQFKVKRLYRFNYTLLPKEAGVWAIKNIQAKIDGAWAKTPDLKIKVKNQGSPLGSPTPLKTYPQQPQISKPLLSHSTDSQIVAPENPGQLFLATEVSKTSAFVGEEIIVNYWVYRSIELQEGFVSVWPNLPGFWKEELDLKTQHSWQLSTFKGKLYRRALLAQYAVFPINPGISKIDSIQYKANIVSLNSTNSWGLRSYRTIPSSQSSPVVKIQVSPLPEEGRPSNFSALVGGVEIELVTPPKTLPVDQAFQLKFKIRGTAHLNSIEDLDLGLPTSFEIFDKEKSITYRPNSQSEGEFTYTIIPKRGGHYQIPPVILNYFNPKTKTYESSKTNSFEVEIQGEGTSPLVATSEPTPSSEEFPTTKEEAYTPKPFKTPISSHKFIYLFGGLTWILSFFIILIKFLFFLYSLYLQTNSYQKSSRKKEMNSLIKEMKSDLKNEKFKEVTESLKSFLSLKYGYTRSEITPELLETHSKKEEAMILGLLNKIHYSKNLPHELKEELKQKLLNFL